MYQVPSCPFEVGWSSSIHLHLHFPLMGRYDLRSLLLFTYVVTNIIDLQSPSNEVGWKVEHNNTRFFFLAFHYLHFSAFRLVFALYGAHPLHGGRRSVPWFFTQFYRNFTVSGTTVHASGHSSGTLHNRMRAAGEANREALSQIFGR